MTARSLIVALWATAVILLASVATAAPTTVADVSPSKAPTPAVDSTELHGQWELIGIVYNGEESDFAAGAVMAFDADGEVRQYENGELVLTGQYHVAHGQRLFMMAEGDKIYEEVGYRIEGNVLTLTFEIPSGDRIVFTFRALGPVESE